MGGWLEVWHFFRVVRPVPRLTRLTFGVLVLMSGILIVLAPERRSMALLPTLVLQAFAVSTGFVGDARRGHFDVLLTRGVGRVQVGVVHWLLTASPGVGCWLLLAGLDAALHRHTPLLATGTVIAVISVSVVPWALSVPLTRGAGAIGWLLVVVCLFAVLPDDAALWGDGGDMPPWMRAVGFVLLPARLMGEDAWARGPLVVPTLVVIAVAMAGALTFIHRADLPLEAGQ